MRVALNAVPLLSPFTGIGQYARGLIMELKRDPAFDVHLFYGGGWSQVLRDAPVPGIDTWKQAVKRYVPRAYFVSRALQQAAFTLGARQRRIELYHEPSFLAFRFRGPTVATVHDLSWIRYPQTHPLARVKALNAMLPSALARCEHVITDAEYVRREVIQTFGIPAERVTAIPLAARVAFHPHEEVACRPSLAARDLQWRRFLLSVGTLEPRKNLRTVLAAYAALPTALRQRFPLAVVGMRGWLDSGVDRAFEPLIAAGAIRFLGYVGDEELARLYAAARILVYPSLYEGFGLPPLEAMASGTPVIVSNASTLPEVVGEAGLIVEPTDCAALTEAVRLLIEDDERWVRLQAAGLARSGEFSWQRCAGRTAAIYRQAMQNAR